MKIGIIVHSQTGNTLSVAEKLKEKLQGDGHSVNIEQVIPVDEKQSQISKIQLKTNPDINGYDRLIFGAPVWGFSLSPVMKYYLKQAPSLLNKPVACLVTQAFPYPWMGGNQAIRQFNKICTSKGAFVHSSAIVNWMNKGREQQIVEAVRGLTNSFVEVPL